MLRVFVSCLLVAGIVSTQHGSRKDAEACASKADPQFQHHSSTQTQLPLQTPRVHQRERPAAQLHREAIPQNAIYFKFDISILFLNLLGNMVWKVPFSDAELQL